MYLIYLSLCIKYIAQHHITFLYLLLKMSTSEDFNAKIEANLTSLREKLNLTKDVTSGNITVKTEEEAA